MDFSHILKAHAPLSRVQICEYWHQMLEAVHFIHEKGNLVHSDLKPANFLMAKGRLKLIDFGIAQKIPIGTIHISREAIIGTPNYMAPEAIKIAKAHGRRVYKAGKASDVWSLGCILYQMVYGRPPFDRLSGEKKLEAIMDPAHDIPFPPHRVLDDPTSEPVDAPMLEALTTSLRYDAQTRAQIPALLSSELFHHHLGETVTISRKTLRALVVRLQQHAIQGELTDATAILAAARIFRLLYLPLTDTDQHYIRSRGQEPSRHSYGTHAERESVRTRLQHTRPARSILGRDIKLDATAHGAPSPRAWLVGRDRGDPHHLGAEGRPTTKRAHTCLDRRSCAR